MNHTLDILYGGEPLEKADKALIMLHGRGAGAESILPLAPHSNCRALPCWPPCKPEQLVPPLLHGTGSNE